MANSFDSSKLYLEEPWIKLRSRNLNVNGGREELLNHLKCQSKVWDEYSRHFSSFYLPTYWIYLIVYPNTYKSVTECSTDTSMQQHWSANVYNSAWWSVARPVCVRLWVMGAVCMYVCPDRYILARTFTESIKQASTESLFFDKICSNFIFR